MSKRNQSPKHQVKPARATQRRAKPSPLALDAALPTTIAEIEAAQELAMQEMAEEASSRVEHHVDSKAVHMGPAAARFIKLQVQLFRVVFGREPSEQDPLYWDREREREGVFRVDPAKDERAMREITSAAGVRPDVAYAMAITGLVVTEGNASMHSERDLAVWGYAVNDYRHQAATGVVPLTPTEFIDAWTAMNALASRTRPGALNSAWGMGQLVTAVREALGSDERVGAAMTRLTALVALGASGGTQSVGSSTGFSESAVIAAASAEVDRRTGHFITLSFRERIEELLDADLGADEP